MKNTPAVENMPVETTIIFDSQYDYRVIIKPPFRIRIGKISVPVDPTTKIYRVDVSDAHGSTTETCGSKELLMSLLRGINMSLMCTAQHNVPFEMLMEE